jgi:UDP-N-acetylmuramoylalanine--D-glutamate ligase
MTRLGYCKGAPCIDCSIDSTPSRTATTLRAVKSSSIVLLLGGASKNLSLSPLIEALDARIRAIHTFGREGKRLFDAISGSPYQGALTRHLRFDDAVQAAAEELTEGDLLLLSPACTSYDEFQNYTERSRRFRALLGLDEKGKETS